MRISRYTALRRCFFVVVAVVSFVAGGVLAAWAHHSYSMFDRTKTRTYEGVVRIWEFDNPHAHLWLYINDKSGTPQLWSLEAPGPNSLIRNGWNKNTVKPGDKITVTINPLRDGRNGGNLLKITLADGRSMSTAGAIPGVQGGPSILNNGPEAVSQ